MIVVNELRGFSFKALTAGLMIVGGVTQAQFQQISANDRAAGDWFGVSLATDGKDLFVSAPQDDTRGIDSGSIYLFKRQSSGLFSQSSKILLTTTEAGASFGFDLDLDGDTLVAGAPDFDTTGTGKVHVYRRSAGGSWLLRQFLNSSSPNPNGRFGVNVAIEGDFIAVGAENEDGDFTDQGAVHVFEKDQTGNFVFSQQLSHSSAASGDRLGTRVHLAGNLLFASSFFSDTSATNGGAVIVFERDQSGTWSETQTIVPQDVSPNDNFGNSLATQGDLLFVGSTGVNSGTGAVYVFRRNGSEYGQIGSRITPPSPVTGMGFGNNISANRNGLLIGAREQSVGASLRVGSSYLYSLSTDGSISFTQEIPNPAPNPDARFGRFLQLLDSTAYVGAYLDPATINQESLASVGSAFIIPNLPINEQSEISVTSVNQGVSGSVAVSFTVNPASPTPANGYSIRLLAVISSEDCASVEGLDDNAFDDVTAFVSGDTMLTPLGGDGVVDWNIVEMPIGELRNKYFRANTPVLFRVVAEPF